MAQAMKKAKTMPALPPMALPMRTIRTVRRERRRVVLSRFIVLPPTMWVIAGGNKKDLYPRRGCLDKGLVDRNLPRSRAFRPS